MSKAVDFSHFLELKSRISFILICYAILVLPLVIFSSQVFSFFCEHLSMLPQSQLIATEVTAPFMVPLKLALYIGIYLMAPIMFYQAWRFLAPGLYPHEKKPIFLLSFFSLLLFYLGVFFAFKVVCPITLKFFAMMAPRNVLVMTDIGLYLSFILKMLLCFGLAFQVPIIVCVLIMWELSSPDSLKKKRPMVIIGAFIIGMLLTPPDVVSQILMAVPMIGLFELGLVLGNKLKAKPKEISSQA